MTSSLRIILLIMFLYVVGSATIIHVPQGQPTIQDGIDAAGDGDTVLVDTGKYVENINFKGKNIVVGSNLLTTGDTSYIRMTVIDGGGIDSSQSVVRFEDAETLGAVLNGFTIINGFSTYGGGIFVEDSSPLLRNLVIIGNRSNMGGGIFFSHSSAVFEDCLIEGNVSQPNATDAGGIGGGIACLNSKPIFKRIVISGNKSTVFGYGYGGGVALFDSDPIFQRVLIVDNVARGLGGGRGAGIAIRNSKPVLINVTVARNESQHDPESGGIFIESGHVYLINSIVWDDSISSDCNISAGVQAITVAFSDLIGGLSNISFLDIGACTVYWEDGNIESDPLFIDPENGDFTLNEESLCVDKGTAFLVLEGDTLVKLSPDDYVGYAPDMGAFESPYSASITEDKVLPEKFALHQNFPNPFNPTTTFQYDLPRAGFVSLTIYDLLGKEVEVAVKSWQEAGRHSVVWNAGGVPTGIYFVRMVSGEFKQTRKMIVLK